MAGKSGAYRYSLLTVSSSQPRISRHHHQRNCPAAAFPRPWSSGTSPHGRKLYARHFDHKACRGGEQFAPEKMAARRHQPQRRIATFRIPRARRLGPSENDPEFQRLLLHSALEKHELAQMFFDQFVRRVYESWAATSATRQREGAFIDVDPANSSCAVLSDGDAPLAQQQSLIPVAAC